MYSWLRLNPDPHHASSFAHLATSGMPRVGQSVDSRPEPVWCDVLCHATIVGHFISSLRFRPYSVFAVRGFFLVVGPARLDRRFDEVSPTERRTVFVQ